MAMSDTPRYNWIERPITREEGLAIKLERIEEAARDLQIAVESEIPTYSGEWVLIMPGDPEYDRAIGGISDLPSLYDHLIRVAQ